MSELSKRAKKTEPAPLKERVISHSRYFEGAGYLEDGMRRYKEAEVRALSGRILIKGKEQPWYESRQGRGKTYLHPKITDTASGEWRVFIHEIRGRSGKHSHQGGIVLYVLQGKGYTVFNGERVDWEEGDLVLLPYSPEGIEHQHFSAEPDKPARWLAVRWLPFNRAIPNFMDQKESSPRWGKDEE